MEILTQLSRQNACNITKIDTMQDTYSAISKAILGAKKTVCDVTITEDDPSKGKAQAKGHDTYVKAIMNVCKEGNVIYNEVTNLSKDKYIAKAKSLLEDGYNNYHLRYFDSHDAKMPIISFIIIDDETLFISCYSHVKWEHNDVCLVVHEKELITFFRNYHTILWENSKDIKTVDMVDEFAKNDSGMI